MELKEEFLQHIWKYGLFKMPLRDMDDRPVELVHPGQHNRDAGPDFFNARIRSEGILWVGNVEIHRKASEWYQHGHHLDRAFDNVILHVVTEPDCQVRNSRGREIRTVTMEVEPEVRIRYELLMEVPEFIPCWREIHRIDQDRMGVWLKRLLVERFEEKIARVLRDLKQCGGDWQEVMYLAMARAFGQKVNADPFEMLAGSVPYRSIRKNCKDPISREALLFGQAGMLKVNQTGSYSGEPGKAGMMKSRVGLYCGRSDKPEEPLRNDPYYTELCRVYHRLQQKLGIRPMDGFLWKFLRLRPDNFPTIRISQFAASLGKYPDLFGQLRDHPDPHAIVMKMEIRASEYWTTHYRFGRKSPAREKSIGKNRLNGLFVNAILPVILAEKRIRGDIAGMAGLEDILRRIPAEDNRIIRMWKSLGREVPDIFSSQALLQLTKKLGLIK